MSQPDRSPQPVNLVAFGVERERRTEARIQVKYVRCWLPTNGAIVDISRHGVLLESFRRFLPAESIFLSSRVGAETFAAAGRVRWCRQIARAGLDAAPVYHVGVRLLQRAATDEWIQALQSSSLLTGAGRLQ